MSQLGQLNLAALTAVEKLKLDVTVNDDPSPSILPLPQPLLPSRLTSLTLNFYEDSKNSENVCRPMQLQLAAIDSCHQLERLELFGSSSRGSSSSDSLELDFSPLRRLTKLRHF